MEIQILKTLAQNDYELLDSGDGEKLERFGKYVLRRPDPQALWEKKMSKDKWDDADCFFSRDEVKGKWNFKNGVPKSWEINFGGLNIKITPSAFKHTGIFPEQLPNWQWTEKIISDEIKNLSREVSVINFFGYTGGASLIATKAGAKVVHVDASKSSIKIARENSELSKLSEAPIRWILDDAKEFVKKELKRGKRYDGIILDPPAFGRGPSGEVWKIEKDFVEFVKQCMDILSDRPLFFLINGYASGYSSIAYENNIEMLKNKFGGMILSGELAIEESNSGRLLPAGIFSRWAL